MDRLQNLETFVRVAETKNFTEAARQLRLARSVVTTRIQQLEAHVGAPLFFRSTRNVQLTEVGRAYLSDCVELVSRATELVDQMRDVRDSPRGTLKIYAATGFVQGHFAPMLHDFQKTYPDIHIDLNVTDEMIDPVKTGVDCALQIHPTTSSDLVSRPLFPVRRFFCATDAYLASHGSPPKHPRDLHDHRVAYYSRYSGRDKWVFYKDDQELAMYLTPVLLSNSIHMLYEYALQDAAIVCLPTWVAWPALLDGRLRIILEDYYIKPLTLSAVFSPTSRNAFKLRLFLDFLTSRFPDPPGWEVRLIDAGVIPHQWLNDRRPLT